LRVAAHLNVGEADGWLSHSLRPKVNCRSLGSARDDKV
jgi:hypothetical protein